MKKVCFYCVYDHIFKDTAKGMVRSVKRFYPDIPFIEYEIEHREKDGAFDLESYTDKVLKFGRELLVKYERVIMMDPDQVMCNKCPDLFDDYKLGVSQNNVYGETETYTNAGLEVCTSIEVWDEIIAELDKRRKVTGFQHLDHQNALNWVFHNSSHKSKFKLLEFVDRVYGITGLAHYEGMELRDSEGNVCLAEPPDNAELYLPSNKKLCIFHAAGTYWKTGNKINFEFIKNELARAKLISYTK